jgi:uncharacterized RDD family membrane protein YckC
MIGVAPGVFRRLASAVYDGLLVLAVLFVASYLFLLVLGDATKPPLKPVYQCYLLTVCAAYFVGFWHYGGQTLAMKTWRFKLVAVDGRRLAWGRLVMRFLLAPVGLLAFWWAWLDSEHCFLHDRLAGTRLVMVESRRPN